MSKIDDSLLLSDEEKYCPNRDCNGYTYTAEVLVSDRCYHCGYTEGVKAQLAKDEAELKGIREQTLREVGETILNIIANPKRLGYRLPEVEEYCESLKAGRMP